jgi:hypothetical protein
LTFSNVFVDNGLCHMCQNNWVFGVFWEPRLGALRTAVISGSSGFVAGFNTRPRSVHT